MYPGSSLDYLCGIRLHYFRIPGSPLINPLPISQFTYRIFYYRSCDCLRTRFPCPNRCSASSTYYSTKVVRATRMTFFALSSFSPSMATLTRYPTGRFLTYASDISSPMFLEPWRSGQRSSHPTSPASIHRQRHHRLVRSQIHTLIPCTCLIHPKTIE